MHLLYWRRKPGSLRVVRTSRRPFQMVLYGLRRSNRALTLLAPESWKSASRQKRLADRKMADRMSIKMSERNFNELVATKGLTTPLSIWI